MTRFRRRDRIRTLIIAESANPEVPSVPLVGWQHSVALSELVESHLVTQVRNKAAILRSGQFVSNITFIDSEKLAAPAWHLANAFRGDLGKGWTVVSAFSILSYYYFERLLWKTLGPELSQGRFDLVHRVTPLRPISPSRIAKKLYRIGIPFVVGPLNGGLAWPREFHDVLRAERDYLSYVRGMSWLLPGNKSTAKYASAIIAGSRDVWAKMASRYEEKCIHIPENGFDPEQFRCDVPTRVFRPPLRVVFIGRLVPYKGADILLEAAGSFIRDGKLTVSLVGDGPQRADLMKMVEELGISHGVCSVGQVSHTDVHSFLTDAHVLALPSIREFGGAVVVEAMAMGVVPIVVNYGGPADITTAETGYLVNLGSRERIIDDYKKVFSSIVEDPSLLRAKSIQGVKRARTLFTWQSKAAQVLEVYKWVLGQRADKPDFGMPLGRFTGDHLSRERSNR